MTRSPQRNGFALLMTLLVGALLGIATYSFFTDATGVCRYADKNLKIAWSQLDFPHRVQYAMNRANTGSQQARVRLLMSDDASPFVKEEDVTVVGMEQRGTLRGFNRGGVEELGVAGFLFGVFGLFILWYGRDPASWWLGLFGAAYGAALFRFYGPLPEWGMLLAWVTATVLSFVAAYALYATAEAFAFETAAPGTLSRRTVLGVRTVVIAGLAIALLATLAEKLVPIVNTVEPSTFVSTLRAAGDVFTEIFVKALIPVALLGFAWWFARDATARRKYLAILTIVAVGLSGVAISIVSELEARRPPAFDWPWFTLLALPLGFIIAIRAYKIVDVQVVITRILVVTAMTAIIGAVIAETEVLIERMADPMIDRALALKFAVAFVIVLTFGRLHNWLDETFKRIIFAKRDQGIADLHAFAFKHAAFFLTREHLIEQTVATVRHSVCASGAAFYEPDNDPDKRRYCLANATGSSFARHVDLDDPALVALRSGEERLDLAKVPVPSAFGANGVAFWLSLRDHPSGVLVIGAREKAADGEYEREELDAVSDVARGVADALFALIATEKDAFVDDVADGKLKGSDAVRRAGELRQATTGRPAAAREDDPQHAPGFTSRTGGARAGRVVTAAQFASHDSDATG